jgi:hypothetical protein
LWAGNVARKMLAAVSRTTPVTLASGRWLAPRLVRSKMIFNSPNEPACYLFVTQNCDPRRQPDAHVTFRTPDAPAQAGRVPGGQQPDDRCQHDERLLERRWISSRKVSRGDPLGVTARARLRPGLVPDARARLGSGLPVPSARRSCCWRAVRLAEPRYAAPPGPSLLGALRAALPGHPARVHSPGSSAAPASEPTAGSNPGRAVAAGGR